MIPVRYCKIALVASVALFATLVVFNNITDYGSNFKFVEHVLMMDTIFPDRTMGQNNEVKSCSLPITAVSQCMTHSK